MTGFGISRWSCRLLSPLLVVASMLAPAPALAEEGAATTEQRAAAQALFERARDLMLEGNPDQACPLLEESQRLDAGLGTQLNLAACYEALGKLASAYVLFTEVAATARARGHEQREQIARERAEELKPQLCHLTIVVSAEQADRIVVERDGVVLGQAQWGLAVPVDPGTHSVRASGPGLSEWRVEVEVPGAAAAQTIEIPRLAPRAPLTTLSHAGLDPGRAEDRGRSFFSATHRKVGLVAAGVGVVGVAVGSIFGLRAISRSDDSDRLGCVGDLCPTQAGVDARGEAESAGNVSTVSMIGGLAGLATASVLFLIRDDGADGAALGIAPAAAPGAAELSIRGRF